MICLCYEYQVATQSELDLDFLFSFLVCRLTELNVSWCDFSSEHVKAVVSNVNPSISQLNISGYRQNLTMEGKHMTA